MPILCRPAREEDLERSDQLVVASINDLTQRHGFGPMAAAHPHEFQLFSLKDDANGLWVAEEVDQILGFAWSWVCGDLWFLAQLFVSPDHQGRNIGNELLKRTFEQCEEIRRYQEGSDHLHVQHRIAGTLQSERPISALSHL
jgi:ribosomal protein S18 acetylase RimI-like enzyme